MKKLPSFLIKIIQQNNYHIPDLENITVSDDELGSFDIDDIKLEVLLFQTGYLTIKKLKIFFNQRRYELGYPNLEVRSALNNVIFNYLLSNRSLQSAPMFNAIIDNDL